MPRYQYSAVDTNGKITNGTMDVTSREQLLQRIKEKGLFILSVTDKQENALNKPIGGDKKVSTKNLAIFCRQFATLINAGITAVKSLDILYSQTEDKVLKDSLGKIYEGVQKGEAMSEAFKKQGRVYPELFTNMILAGESSGSLDSVLLRMADHYEKENKLNNKIKSSTTYPIVLATLTVAVVLLMVVFIIPQFTEYIISGGGKLPLPTRMLMNLGTFVQKFWWLLAGIIVILLILWRAYIRGEKGRLWWDTKKMNLPIIGKSMKMVYTARFARTLSTLLSSGIQMLPSLDITSRVVNNQLIHDKLITTMEEIRKGISLSLSLQRIDQFPPMLHNMVSVGEESGLLDDILVKTAAFYDEESEAAIQRMVSLIEPILIILMGGIIGFIVISIFLPMLSMYETI